MAQFRSLPTQSRCAITRAWHLGVRQACVQENGHEQLSQATKNLNLATKQGHLLDHAQQTMLFYHLWLSLSRVSFSWRAWISLCTFWLCTSAILCRHEHLQLLRASGMDEQKD